MSTHRIYTEEEVTALLERAADLQAQLARRAEHRPGLTLSELEAVAADAGLDPSLVRQAAAEMDEPDRPRIRHGVGTSATHVYVERWVPGPLTPEAWEDIVVELRHQFDTDLGSAMGVPGYGNSAVEQIGRTVAWKHMSLSGVETRLMIRPREDRLHVRLSRRVGWGSPVAESVTYGSVLAGLIAFLAGALAGSPLVGGVTLLVALFTVIPLIHYADRSWREKKHRELEDLADRVTTLLAPASSTRPAESRPVRQHRDAAAPILDRSLLEADETPSEAAPQRSLTRGAESS